MQKKYFHGILFGLAAAAIGLVLFFTGVLDSFEGSTWDMRQQVFAQPGEATDEIVIILLDQKSLDWGKEENGLSWPWPREVYSYIINFLLRGNPKSLAFDVVYTEPSAYGVYDDAAFAGAIDESDRFISTVFLTEDRKDASVWPEEAPLPPAVITAEKEGGRESQYQHADFPIPEIISSAELLANVNLKPDKDGVFRRSRLLYYLNDTPVPSMALASYLVGSSGKSDITFTPRNLIIDDKKIPLDKDGNTILRFRGGSQTHTTFNAAEIIRSEIAVLSGEEPSIDPSVFQDTYIFFGFSAPGLMDLRPVPVAEVYPGVEVHATMLDNLLSNDFIKPLSLPAVILITCIISLGAAILVTTVSRTGLNAALYVIILLVPIALSVLMFRMGTWFPFIAVEISAAFALVGSGILKYSTEGQQKRFIKSAFKQYLSPAVIEQLINQPERLKLGGERRELSIFFSDIQGFTSISETLSPEDLTALLNEYLSAMTDIIQDYGGTVDKYEGDAIIAFWNAPLPLENHARAAVETALRCQKKLKEMGPEIKKRIGKELLMRIGMNTGHAVVGNMGSHSRFDYTMLGDAVNLAARLEGINKQFGTYTMISESTYELVKDAFPARELSRVAVVGRKEPVRVFEPFFPDDFAGRKEDFELFSRGLELFYKGDFEKAVKVFEGTAERDPAAGSYRKKCQNLLGNPPEDWGGVWIMTEK